MTDTTSTQPNIKADIKSRILKTELINWKEAQWLQNRSLKAINDESKQKLKTSLVENDFVMPFHIWEEADGTKWILDGHHREHVLKELETEGIAVPEQLPATFVHCHDKQEAAKLVLIYSSIYAKITVEGLKEFAQLHELEIEAFSDELDIPDFSMPRFEQEMSKLEEQEESEPAVGEFSEIVVKEGDLFRLGKHLVYCGDGLDKEQWDKLLLKLNEINGTEGVKVRQVYTDPPYNVTADSIGNLGKTKHENFAQAAGEMSDDEFVLFLRKMMEVASHISVEGALHYYYMDFRHVWHMTEAAKVPYKSVEPKQVCVWNKDIGGMGSFYRSKHEFCFIFKYDPTGKAKHLSNIDLKDRIRWNVWEYPSGNSMRNPDKAELKAHPTPKNVAMSVDAILDVTKKGDVVADFFLGSGTTLVAADKVERVAIVSELEPKFTQHSLVRYFKHCEKEGKEIDFEHLNGELTVEGIRATENELPF